MSTDVHTRHWSRGATIGAHVRLQPMRDRPNPGKPAWEALQLRRGIQATGWVSKTVDVWEVTGTAFEDTAWVDSARWRFRDWSSTHLGPRSAALLQAVVLGDSGVLDSSTRAAWRDAGLAHLLAISGLHVGVIAWVVFRLCGWALSLIPFFSKRWPVGPAAGTVALAAAWAYVWIAGAPISAVRAGWMLTGLFGAAWFCRPADSVSGLALALLLVVCHDSSATMDPSFQLSFLAVSSLVLGMRSVDRIGNWVEERIPWGLVRVFLRSIVRTIGASLLCTAATAPIVWWYFGELSIHGIWANTIAIPLVSVGVVIPGLCAFFMLCCGLTVLTGPLTSWVEFGARSAHAFSQWVSHGLEAHLLSMVTVVVFLFVLLSIGLGLLRTRPHRILWACVLILLGLFCWEDGKVATEPLRMTFLAVGHGDAIVVQTPKGRTILIDAGGDPTRRRRIGRDVVIPSLQSLGVDHIDLAVITHPHPDHFLGFGDVLGQVRIGRVWIAHWPDKAGAYAELIAQFRAAEVPIDGPGDWKHTGVIDGVRLNILHPNSVESASWSLNNKSIVIQLVYGRFTALLTGDIEGKAERELVRSGHDLRATILKVPHHGSKTSSSESLLRAVDPMWAVVQCREGGRFNFPHAQVSDRLRSMSIPTSVTGHDGAIQVSTDGMRWSVARFR